MNLTKYIQYRKKIDISCSVAKSDMCVGIFIQSLCYGKSLTTWLKLSFREPDIYKEMCEFLAFPCYKFTMRMEKAISTGSQSTLLHI